VEQRLTEAMSQIRILPDAIANKIAAGEVVERPASVVKELVENALDAGAKSIRVETESGGKRLIRVIDDGCGMNHDDALLAFERHATSKLRAAEDLLSIATLGFRGEALPTIAAISRLVLETRTADEEQGMRVEFAGGKLVSVKPAGLPEGTSIAVHDIFYCVPARRKFLKSETTELGHIASLVTHYALAHPEKHFVLKTPSQEIVNVAPVERLADRVYQLFGQEALAELLEIPPAEGPVRAAITEPGLDADEESAKIRITGFTSRPEVQRANRNGTYIFVNRRLVRDRLLLHAITEAYRNITPMGVFPAVLLFVDLPYREVDVNVHPSKVEVRFRYPQFVHDFTRDAIRNALANVRPIAGFQPGMKAPAQSSRLGMPFGGNGGTRTGISEGDGAGAAHAAGHAEWGAQTAAAAAAGAGSAPVAGPPRAVIPTSFSPGAMLEEGFESSGAPLQPLEQRLQFGAEGGTEFMAPFPGTVASAVAPGPVGAFNGEMERGGVLPRPEEISDLKPLGQVSNSFIIAVNGEGLWIVDQHVAHERILFEQHLRARRAGVMGGQRMLVPQVVELSPRQLATFDQIAEELRANGFETELMGPRSVAILGAPAGITSGDAERLLAEILDGIAKEAQAISIDSLQAKIAASTSCHAAIKVNTPLDSQKMEWLLAELSKAEYPMSCPHGRPVVLRYTVREIERAFKRI
jgi:DNA mismatch repair protein MutL